MEEKGCSWVRRAMFSHTVCHRLDYANLPSILLPIKSESNPQLRPKRTAEASQLSSILLPVDRTAGPKAASSISHSASLSSSQLLLRDRRRGSKTNKSSSEIPISSSRPEQEEPKSGVSNLTVVVSSSAQKADKHRKPKTMSSLEISSFSIHPDQESKVSPNKLSGGSSSFASQSDQDPRLKHRGSNSGKILVSRPLIRFQLDDIFQNNGPISLKDGQKFILRQRSSSPLPTTILSDVFKEARANEKRFSTPPPRREGSEKSVFSKILSIEGREHPVALYPPPPGTNSLHQFSLMRATCKHKSLKEASWARYFEQGGGKVNSLGTSDEWMVDPSQLYVGLRFASGAHSKLHHGIYKDQPVAVKIIRQPDDDENGLMAARLEKQFTREVTLLSHLYHRNVIKVLRLLLCLYFKGSLFFSMLFLQIVHNDSATIH
ncbi:hypothetical protein BHE74_00028446 [Ensete ventricosum]|nr:hypothetical protein BHE74_00028446 [Ensete ventricosum]